MVTPKVNICSPFVGKTQILPTRYLFIHQATERHKSWRKRMNFALFDAPQGPVTTPLWTKNIQQAEFQAVQT